MFFYVFLSIVYFLSWNDRVIQFSNTHYDYLSLVIDNLQMILWYIGYNAKMYVRWLCVCEHCKLKYLFSI